jgi:hypothetical protein
MLAITAARESSFALSHKFQKIIIVLGFLLWDPVLNL